MQMCPKCFRERDLRPVFPETGDLLVCGGCLRELQTSINFLRFHGYALGASSHQDSSQGQNAETHENQRTVTKKG